MINQQTELYGVMGHPIGHSLSPIMHNAAFRVCDLNAVYLAFESRDVAGCLNGMRALGIRGMSVTIPHKSNVIPLLEKKGGLPSRCQPLQGSGRSARRQASLSLHPLG
jgi:shikimate dehydrogenase